MVKKYYPHIIIDIHGEWPWSGEGNVVPSPGGRGWGRELVFAEVVKGALRDEGERHAGFAGRMRCSP